MRTTVMRLDRKATATSGGSTAGLEALQSVYEDLAEAVILSARDRGYRGADPYGALQHLQQPIAEVHRLGIITKQLWTLFFAGFRPDEEHFEKAAFAQRADDLQHQLAQLPAQGVPDLALSEQLLTALVSYWDQRQAEVNQRLDQLISDLGAKQTEAGNMAGHAHQADELARVAVVVRTVLQELAITRLLMSHWRRSCCN